MAVHNCTIPKFALSCEKRLFFCKDSYRAAMYDATVSTVVFNSVFALAAVLGNGLVFAAYLTSESLRRPVFTILMAVALTDLLTGAISQPLFIYVLLKALSYCPDYLCIVDMIGSFFMIFLLGATIINLSVITLDRYISVFYSFRYHELVTNSRVVKLVIVLWSIWIILLLLIGTLRLNLKGYIGVLIGLNIIFICFLYFKILREIRCPSANLVVPVNEPEEVRKARDKSCTITTGYILGLLLICFLPKVILGLIIPQFCGAISHFTIRKLFLISTTLSLSNSSLNVIVYCWKNREMKKAMLKVMMTVMDRVNP